MNIWIALLLSIIILGFFRAYFFRATNPVAFVIDIMLVALLTSSMHNCHGDRSVEQSSKDSKNSTDLEKNIPLHQEINDQKDLEKTNLADYWTAERLWDGINGEVVYCYFTNTSNRSIIITQDGERKEIKPGEGPTIISGKLEVTYDKGLQVRNITVQSGKGFFATTLRFPVSILPTRPRIRYSDQFRWTTETPQRGEYLYGVENLTGEYLRIYVRWQDGSEDFIEISPGNRLALRGPRGGTGLRYYVQLEEGKEETGSISFMPAHTPNARYVFQRMAGGYVEVGVTQ